MKGENYGPRHFSDSGLGPLNWSGVCPRCEWRCDPDSPHQGEVWVWGQSVVVGFTCRCGLRFIEVKNGGDR